MSDEFGGPDATEKAEDALNRCRTLAAQIESELRDKRPEFIDKLLAEPLEDGGGIEHGRSLRIIERHLALDTAGPVE
jgi:hypothetical protein